MTVFGWDASHWDWDRGPMNFAAARSDGISFFTHKIGEGSSYTDPRFGEGVARARDAGFELIGAYYVLHTGNAVGQADRCIALADALAPWWRNFPGWFWQVDAEMWPDDHPPPATCKAMCDRLVARTGRRVILYAPRGHYGNRLTGVGHPLWNANYGSDPVGWYFALYPGDGSPGWAPYSGQTPLFLQYGSKTIIGTQRSCDANAYRGTVEDLRALITGGAIMVDNINDLADVTTALADGTTKSGYVTGIAAPHVLPNTLSIVRTAVQTVQASVNTMAADIQAIKDKLGVAAVDGETLAVDVASAGSEDGDYAALRVLVTALQEEVTALRAQVTVHEAEIARLRAAIGEPALVDPPEPTPSQTEDEPQPPPPPPPPDGG